MLVGTQFRCESDKRRDAVIASTTVNGIDYLEVVDNWAKSSPDSPRQRTLLVHLFKKPSVALGTANVRITGGVRVSVGVDWAYMYGAIPGGTLFPDEQAMLDALPDRDRVLVVRTSSTGDFSTYQLSLVTSPVDDRPPGAFDKKLSTIELSFKVECPTEFDCGTPETCPPLAVTEPEIDYLAKDWSSFRRLMLDRLTATMPDWKERNPADVGTLLVELLAYAGDHLSYFQDAVGTEAYLGTSRKRVSVRRHARMLDYPIFDGSNARTWVAVTWTGSPIALPASTQFATRTPDLSIVAKGAADPSKITAAASVVFESMDEVVLDKGLNQIPFYTWGDDECCLAKGATRATLDNSGNRLASLAKGMVLVFGEVLSPATALPEDADATHRQAVRITSVDLTATDPLFTEADGVTPQRLAEITWHDDDALRFPLCLHQVEPIAKNHPKGRVTLSDTARVPIVIRIAAIDDGTKEATSISWSSAGGIAGTYTTQPVTAGKYTDAATGLVATFTSTFELGETFAFGPAAVAWGNIVPVDHGATTVENLAPVPATGTYRPRLARGPVTQAAAYDGEASATRTMTVERSAVAPAVKKVTFPQEPGVEWKPEPDLLASDAFDPKFVLETEDDDTATLRFGDGVRGREPDASPVDSLGNPILPTATYRVGNGVAGNVGAEAIAHAVFDSSAGTAFDQIKLVRNPLAAVGGSAPETIEQVKLYAPQAFRVQERAVSVDDYATIAERHPQVVKARATRRWTGSWYTIFLSIDRKGGGAIDDAFETDLRRFLELYRLAAQDVEIEPPKLVPLEIELAVCVDARYYRSDVKRALLEMFSSRDMPDGSRGFFHPDNFTFGQPVYLSTIIAKAMTVPGVVWVDPSPGKSVFRRFWEASDATLVKGRIEMARLEIARLDNDPNFPENGRIDFVMDGGM